MTKIEIELPDETAEAARDAGLLTPEALEKLLLEALHRQEAADWLLAIAESVEASGTPPISMEEVTAEVNAVRAERRGRAGSF